MSIYSKNRLKQWAENGGITPFNPAMIGDRPNECCIDVLIGSIDLETEDSLLLPIFLKPNEVRNFVLFEYLKIPDDACGFVSIRSYWARHKRLNQLTSQVIKPGWQGYLILELQNTGNNSVYINKGLNIAQIHLMDVI